MMKPKVTIILVVRETLFFSQRALESLYAHTQLPFKLIYVAGGVPEQDRVLLENEAHTRGFQLIQRPYFLAQNEARNLALPFVDTEFVVLLDNDVIVSSNWLEAMLSCAEETGAEIISPAVFMGEPAENTLHFFTGTCHIVEENGGRRVDERYPYHLLKVQDLKEPLQRQLTEMVEYHCLLLRSSFLEQFGFFDENLKSTRDHHDLALWALQRNISVYAEPKSEVAYLHPPNFLWRELPFFHVRWSPQWSGISHRRMNEKWNVTGSERNMGFLNKHRRIHLDVCRTKIEKITGAIVGKQLFEKIIYPMEAFLADMLASCNERKKRNFLKSSESKFV